MSPLEQPVTLLAGIGSKRAELLAGMGIQQVRDFLTCYPRDYEDRTRVRPIMETADGEKVCIRGTAAETPVTVKPRQGMSLTKVWVFDDSGAMHLVFFNNPYVKKQLVQGEEFIFYGAVKVQGSYRSMANPTFEGIGKGRVTGRIVPVYPLTAGITRYVIMTGVAAALNLAREYPPEDILPPRLIERYKLCPITEAYEKIHRPQSFDDVQKARRRLVFEELFLFACAGKSLKQTGSHQPGRPIEPREGEDFFAQLPFAPTNAQRRAVGEIFGDMTSGKRMNRLLQGDVGSGKTLVAAAAAWLTVENGYQAVMMAPTELLANQHYGTMTQLFGAKARIGLLTASMTAAQKRKLKEQVSAGVVDILCGTHALIQEDVVFYRAGLFVVDEQHRFGVRQRAALGEKCEGAHLLVMSATPIPRTLTLIIFGDLDLSLLDELPPGRQKIETYCIGEDKRQRMLGFIRRQAAEGGQVYIVCPVIEEQETGGDKVAAVKYAATLEKELPGLRIGLMHGKLKGTAKDEIMGDFAAGRLDILVSTTVIEVGVNVPNATLMVVENADFFGLSQLHQLRGRVGRGNRQSYCILMGKGGGEAAKARLATLCKTNDGFLIAEEDLRLRGPGDFLGTRQHGLPDFKIASLAGDTRILEAAMASAKEILEEDPGLTGYPLLRQRITQQAEGAIY